MSASKHSIFCAGYNHPAGYLVTALGDDGVGIAQHLCSHQGYARHDIGMDGSNWKHEHYNAHFGEGNWELEWVDDVKTHEGWRAALALNHAANPESDEPETEEAAQ